MSIRIIDIEESSLDWIDSGGKGGTTRSGTIDSNSSSDYFSGFWIQKIQLNLLVAEEKYVREDDYASWCQNPSIFELLD